MIISRDKEFIRRKDEARQPAREPVKDTLAGKDRSVQDYDLRRARDAPATSKGRHRQRQPEPEYPSAAVEGALEEQNSYLSDREADISRTGADAASFYEKTGYEEYGQPEYQREHFSFRQPESSGSSGGTGKADGSEHTKHRSALHQHGNKYHQRFQEAAKAEEQPEPLPEDAKKTSKLEFTADELPPETADKKLTHARRKAERIEEKLAQAEKRLPSRKSCGWKLFLIPILAKPQSI